MSETEKLPLISLPQYCSYYFILMSRIFLSLLSALFMCVYLFVVCA